MRTRIVPSMVETMDQPVTVMQQLNVIRFSWILSTVNRTQGGRSRQVFCSVAVTLNQ